MSNKHLYEFVWQKAIKKETKTSNQSIFLNVKNHNRL